MDNGIFPNSNNNKEATNLFFQMLFEKGFRFIGWVEDDTAIIQGGMQHGYLWYEIHGSSFHLALRLINKEKNYTIISINGNMTIETLVHRVYGYLHTRRIDMFAKLDGYHLNPKISKKNS